MELNSKNTSLFFVIENKHNLIIETKRSIYHIIENQSWIKTIKIYLVTPTNLFLPKNIKKEFLDIYENIEFIEKDIVRYSDHVFFNMIYGCYLAEEKIKSNYLIYLDCDMYLVNNFPSSFKGELILESEGYYNEESDKWLMTKKKWLNMLKIKNSENIIYTNTEFIITNTELKIFSKWLNTFENLYPKLKKIENKYPKIGFDISCMEETSFEIMVLNNHFDRILYLPNLVARLGNPTAIPDTPKAKKEILFISQHLEKIDDILFDYTSDFKQNTITMELIYSCEFDCFFCEKPNLEKPIILELDKFKKYLDKLIINGITTIDLTPTKGDILNIPNLVEYLKILENSDINNYYFYTSIATNRKLSLDNEYDKELINFINTSKKIYIYYSCYLDNDFQTFYKIVRKDKSVYDLNILNSKFLLKNINKNKITFIDRVNKYPFRLLIKNNHLARLAHIKQIPIICEDDDLKQNRDNFLRHTAFCEQFLCCSTLKINGDLVYCNYGKSYYDGVVEHISTFTNNNLLTKELINNDLCKNCLYKMESGISELIWNKESFLINHSKETSC